MSVRLLKWLGAVGVVASCAQTGANKRLDDIETRLQQEQHRLEAVRAEVAATEARAQAAREEAEFQSCRAQAMELRAEVERRRGECAKAVADRNLCAARNSERTAQTGLGGCLVGIAAAAMSGGAAAPWALGGCAAGLGAGALSEDVCPSAECANHLDDVEAEVLAARQLIAVPRCGGYLGLELATAPPIIVKGVLVKEVILGTYSDAANMAAGDLLLSVNGRTVAGSDDVEAALETVAEGSPLWVEVLRNGRRFKLSSKASRRIHDGRLASSVKLGVELGHATTQASHGEGVLVSKVVDGSPAALAGVQAGDLVKEIGVPNGFPEMQAVSRIGDVEWFLGDKRAPEHIKLALERRAKLTVAQIQLEKRQTRPEL